MKFEELFNSYNQLEIPQSKISQTISETPKSKWDKFLNYFQTKVDQSNIQNDGISDLNWIYNPKLSSTSTIQSKTSTKYGTKDENARYAFSYLVKNGIPKKSASGIVANLYHENLGNPEQMISDSKGTTSYGIACFNSKGELNNLRDFAKSIGTTNLNMDTQLAFLVHVVNTRFKKLKDPNTTPEEASFIFGRDFEKFAGRDGSGRGYKNYEDPEHSARRNTAIRLYNLYNKS